MSNKKIALEKLKELELIKNLSDEMSKADLEKLKKAIEKLIKNTLVN